MIPQPTSSGGNGVQSKGTVKAATPQPEWNITDDGKGVLTGSLKLFYDIPTGTAVEDIPAPVKGSLHPYNEKLICHDVQTTFGSNNIAYCDAKYVGLLQDPSGIEWNLSCPTEEDPIQVHPAFLLQKDKKGSFGIVEKDGEAPLNKPKWVGGNVVTTNKGDFVSFAASPDMLKKDLVGVTSFKVARANIKVSLHTANTKMLMEAIRNVGNTYGKPPFAPEWCAAEGRNWLFLSLSVSEYAGIYKLDTEYMLSGLDAEGKGKTWNPLIYKSAK